jgi:hypothetical protein
MIVKSFWQNATLTPKRVRVTSACVPTLLCGFIGMFNIINSDLLFNYFSEIQNAPIIHFIVVIALIGFRSNILGEVARKADLSTRSILNFNRFLQETILMSCLFMVGSFVLLPFIFIKSIFILMVWVLMYNVTIVICISINAYCICDQAHTDK